MKYVKTYEGFMDKFFNTQKDSDILKKVIDNINNSHISSKDMTHASKTYNIFYIKANDLPTIRIETDSELNIISISKGPKFEEIHNIDKSIKDKFHSILKKEHEIH